MQLRPYQKACVDAVLDHAAQGITEQLIVLPTGSGKTRIVAALPKALELNPFESTLFLVLSDELATQAADTFKALNPDLVVEVEMGERRADPNSDVIVASIQTLSRPDRRSKFNDCMFRLINYDEGHHAVARESLAVLEHFHALKGEPSRDPSILLTSTTATPRRSDTRGLEKVFSKIVFKRSIRQMQVGGWLADLEVWRVPTTTDISGVKTHHGDFSQKPLEQAVNTPERNALVVKKYLEFGAGLPFLAFAVDVQHAQDLADTFQHYGIHCQALSGKTPTRARREMVDAHRNGVLLGISSCQAITEGFDSPRATVACMCAPTISSLVYTQKCGRISRPFPSPEDAPSHRGYVKKSGIILDFCDFDSSHRLFNASTLYGLNADFDLQGKSARRTIEEVERLEAQHPTLDLRRYANLEDVEAAVERVDPFSASGITQVSKRLSRFAWLKQSEDVYRLGLANGTVMWIEVDQLGQAEVFTKQSDTTRTSSGGFETAEEAFAFADSCVPVDAIGVALSTARWRTAAPSDKQAALIWRIDKQIRERFSSADSFYRYAVGRFRQKDKAFTKGAFSQRIDTYKFKLHNSSQ